MYDLPVQQLSDKDSIRHTFIASCNLFIRFAYAYKPKVIYTC